jgi:hypothetical protein
MPGTKSAPAVKAANRLLRLDYRGRRKGHRGVKLGLGTGAVEAQPAADMGLHQRGRHQDHGEGQPAEHESKKSKGAMVGHDILNKAGLTAISRIAAVSGSLVSSKNAWITVCYNERAPSDVVPSTIRD